MINTVNLTDFLPNLENGYITKCNLFPCQLLRKLIAYHTFQGRRVKRT